MKMELKGEGTHTHNALALRHALDAVCQVNGATHTQAMLRRGEDGEWIISVTSAGYEPKTEAEVFARDTEIGKTLAPLIVDSWNAAFAANTETAAEVVRQARAFVVEECGDAESAEVAALDRFIALLVKSAEESRR